MVHFALRSLKDTLTYACTYICDCECVYFWFLRSFAATVSNETAFMVTMQILCVRKCKTPALTKPCWCLAGVLSDNSSLITLSAKELLLLLVLLPIKLLLLLPPWLVPLHLLSHQLWKHEPLNQVQSICVPMLKC